MNKNDVIREWEIEHARLFGEVINADGMTPAQERAALQAAIYGKKNTITSQVSKEFIDKLLDHKIARVRAEAKSVKEAIAILEQ